MSKIDYQALREAAEKATKGSYIVGHTSVNQHGNLTGVFVCQKWKGEPGGVIAECHVNCLVKTDVQAYANAEFIAEANPATVLALLDEREADKKRIAELEAREILLPERSSMLHRTDFHDDYQTVMAYKVSEVIAAIRSAGIRIKGE
ncbi:ead/Ea22-like family protein [Escherichia marmotae]|nr:ead/Ea22-like family protein [Escherichia marmotae]MBY7485535.1 ead/Ea22-like family protein [Escherichia marmotae]MCT6427855.1 ead/Ea22-like family protein [Escherichia coli]